MKVAPLVLERGNWWSFSYLPEEGESAVSWQSWPVTNHWPSERISWQRTKMQGRPVPNHCKGSKWKVQTLGWFTCLPGDQLAEADIMAGTDWLIQASDWLLYYRRIRSFRSHNWVNMWEEPDFSLKTKVKLVSNIRSLLLFDSLGCLRWKASWWWSREAKKS